MARPGLSTSLSCLNPRAEIDWLQKAFGFELTMLIEDETGGVAHSQMELDGGTIMVGGEWSADHKSPKSLEGKNTQSVHIQIDTDVDANCARAKAAGADVFAEPEDQFYGDRSYRCRDPEGHIWTIGQTVVAITREEAEVATGLKITGWS